MKVHVHGQGTLDAVTLDRPTDRPLVEIVEELRGAWDVDIVALSLQDADEDLDLTVVLQDAGIREGQRLHAHRCKIVAISVMYEDRTLTHPFRPNKRIAGVREWAIGKDGFDIKDRSAADLVLGFGNPLQRAPEGMHVGDLPLEHCAITLSLVPSSYFQG